ncbi:hypothetical protein [Allokutzneria albata]|uniref:Uncharacterized protein n=1 Tax=Allokutzneria albata TaxID=211114 RepID=A0A1G9SBL8_ALLAB|nr:hypothetical protein [Allokutzneria albata]SDM32864.1 hypothetical protein SAMN04489726_1048 [Allokutzneria albata]
MPWWTRCRCSILADAGQALDDAATQRQEHTAGSSDPAAEGVHDLLHAAKDGLSRLP